MLNHTGVGAYSWSAGHAGSSQATARSSTAANATTIVIQLSHAKLPVSTSQPCVRTITAAATVAIAPSTAVTSSAAPLAVPIAPAAQTSSTHGATSCATWLPSTSTLCHQAGARCAQRLSGPGIGCVSWWNISAVRSRHSRPPRSLIMPAPNSSRNTSHTTSSSASVGGAWSSAPRNAIRKPASHSSSSQPKP